jgi:hypothetical protein
MDSLRSTEYGVPKKPGWLKADNGVCTHLPKGSSTWAGYVKLDGRMPAQSRACNQSNSIYGVRYKGPYSVETRIQDVQVSRYLLIVRA